MLGNFRGIAATTNGVWASGFTEVKTDGYGNIIPAVFGTNQVISDFLLGNNGLTFSRGGVLAKISESSAATAIALLNPQVVGTNFEFQFVSEAGLTHAVQYNTNLVAGTGWQTCTNIAGDGTLKSVAIPLATFTRSGQAFVRVATQ